MPKHKRKPDKGYFVLRGNLSASRKAILVWCPFCNDHHKHGWDSTAPDWAVSFRGAHCDVASPLKAKGYFIGILKPLHSSLPAWYVALKAGDKSTSNPKQSKAR
jgi:hypothetical protein